MSETNTGIDIRTDLMDSSEWEYLLAGELVGTLWSFPDGKGEDEIGEVRQNTTRHEGERMANPEVVLKYSGTRFPVNGFLRRIDPSDVGDIEPRDHEARRIVEVQQDHSWRKLRLCAQPPKETDLDE